MPRDNIDFIQYHYTAGTQQPYVTREDFDRFTRIIRAGNTGDASRWWLRQPTTNHTWFRGVQGTSSADYRWTYRGNHGYERYDGYGLGEAMRDDLWTSTEKYISNIVTSDEDAEIAVADADILEDILRG